MTLFDVHTDRKVAYDHHDEFYKHTKAGWVLRSLLFVVMFIFMFSLIGLCGFHLYLVATNQTTMELFRPDYVDRYSHYRGSEHSDWKQHAKSFLESFHFSF